MSAVTTTVLGWALFLLSTDDFKTRKRLEWLRSSSCSLWFSSFNRTLKMIKIVTYFYVYNGVPPVFIIFSRIIYGWIMVYLSRKEYIQISVTKNVNKRQYCTLTLGNNVFNDGHTTDYLPCFFLGQFHRYPSRMTLSLVVYIMEKRRNVPGYDGTTKRYCNAVRD